MLVYIYICENEKESERINVNETLTKQHRRSYPLNPIPYRFETTANCRQAIALATYITTQSFRSYTLSIS